MVLHYDDKIIISSGTFYNFLFRLYEVFDYNSVVAFSCKSFWWDIVYTQAKYSPQTIFTENIMSKKEVFNGNQVWSVPHKKDQLAIFFSFAKYFVELIQDYALEVHFMLILKRKHVFCNWSKDDSFFTQALALLMDGHFFLDLHASSVVLASLEHQKYGLKRIKALPLVHFSSQCLN